MFNRRAFAQLLAACGVSAAAPAWAQAKTVEVSMAQSPKMRFIPDTVTIKAGDTVKWTNPHNISGGQGKCGFACRCGALRLRPGRGRGHFQPYIYGQRDV
jgi:plastocyanin